MTTPLIPDWIKSLSHPGYRNIFSYGLGNTNLWGTESLLGDWSGRYLLVAKDYYPSQEVERDIEKGVAHPYSHHPGSVTNRNLMKVLRHYGRTNAPHDARKCDFLYISACFLLRADGVVRGPLPDLENVMRVSAPVVKFTMDHMPNLETVVLMGRDAEIGFRIGGGSDLIKERGLKVYQVSHPSRALSDADRFSEWEPVFNRS